MKRLHTLLFVTLLAGVAGCELMSADGPEGIGPIDLSEGSQHVYQHEFTQTDSLGDTIATVAGSYVVTVAHEDDEVSGYDGLIRLDAAALADSAHVSSSWYSHGDRQLDGVAYRNAGMTPTVVPKRAGTNRAPWRLPRIVEDLLDDNPVDDSTIVRDQPRIVYRYPLNVGQEWLSFTQPFRSEREVVAVETVTVKAGTFVCAKIRTHISAHEDLTWYDYVAADGLVLRTLTAERMRRDEDGAPIGTFRTDERLELAERR